MNLEVKKLEEKSKKVYKRPVIEKVNLDSEISLVMMSQAYPTEPVLEPPMSSVFKINRILRG